MRSDQLEERFKGKGYRLTKQREIILEEISKGKTHPSADEIYLMVKKKIPNISFGTVYRNLKVLRDLGLIRELEFSKSFSRYDGNTKDHYHFTCTKCNKIFDLDIPVMEELNNNLRAKTSFQVLFHRLEFYGICHDCSSGLR